MRVAVTTIALNEEKFVERWAESAADADLLCIADTGSTDATVAAARDLGVVVHDIRVRPWRFDVARNAGLALLPDDLDVVITLDMDEVLTPGWRDRLEAAPRVRRYSYDYVWNWTDDGEPDVQFRGDRCHSRFGWQWRHPVHETLVATGSDDPSVYAGFGIHHHADETKPRGQYLDLLERAVRESPDDDRLAHYYARELYFAGQWEKARREFMRHLTMPTSVWEDERCQSYRYVAKMDNFPEKWLLRAVAEAPWRREPWVDLGLLYHQRGRQTEADGVLTRALQITDRPRTYMTESRAWDDDFIRSMLS